MNAETIADEMPTIPEESTREPVAILEWFRPQIEVVESESVSADHAERRRLAEVYLAWLMRSASDATRKAYQRDVELFLRFRGMRPEHVVRTRSMDIAAWRDALVARGLANSSVGRKVTVLRSLFAHLQVHGFIATNPAHPRIVSMLPVSRDGKTVGLSPDECRQLLDAPDPELPVGVRDRALFAVLAYTGCRVGELCRLRVGDLRTTNGHRVLEIRGKGGKERRVPLHSKACDRIDRWLDFSKLREDRGGALFRPTRTARGHGVKGFQARPLTPRAVQLLVARYVHRLDLNPRVTVHSFRVTALTTARERGCDLVDLQDFAGHSDPRTTLSYIRNRDRLNRSPAYSLHYGEESPTKAEC